MISDDPTVDSPDDTPDDKPYVDKVKLTRRMLRMIEMMIVGCHGDPTRTPLGILDAEAVGYFRSAGRSLAKSPTFRKAYDKAVEAYAEGNPLPNPLPTLAEYDECVRLRRLRDELNAKYQRCNKARAEMKHQNIALKAENAALKAALAPRQPSRLCHPCQARRGRIRR